MFTRHQSAGRWNGKSTLARRPQRFLSLSALVMAVGGLGMLMAGLSSAGLFTILSSASLSGWKRAQGTLVDTSMNRDEREKALFMKASLIGFTGAFVLAVVTLMYLGLAVPSPELANRSIAQTHGYAIWYPRNWMDWIALVLGLQAMQSGIALMWANWSVPTDQAIWADE